MYIDYFHISQLKVQDIYPYLSQIKESKSTHREKKQNYLLNLLGIEFLILTVVVITFGIISTPYIIISGTIAVFLYLTYDFILTRRITKVSDEIKSLREDRVKVIKKDKIVVVPADKVNIGETVIISKGERVIFDLRVIESNSLIVDESKIFGESKLSPKSATTLAKKDFKLYELSNIVFANSLIVRGYGKGIVINKPQTHSSYTFNTKTNYNLTHILGVLALSILAGIMNFLITIGIENSILLGILLNLILSMKHIFKISLIVSLQITEKLIQNGIVPPSFIKSENWQINNIIIKVNSLSFSNQKVKYFIPKFQKTLSEKELIQKSELTEDMILWFAAIFTLYSKTKNINTKIKILPIIDNLISIGISKETIKEHKVIDFDISNSLENLSTIKLKNKNEITVGILSLNSYLEKFGSIIGLNLMNRDGILIIKKEETSMKEFEPMVVILFEDFDLKPEEIDLLSKKIYIFSELSYKELKKYFEILKINIDKISSLGIEDFIKAKEEERKFYIGKFQMFFNINPETERELTKYFESEEYFNCFIEISSKHRGIMKIPYFGYTYSKNNLILSTTNSILAPFIFIKELNKLKEIEKTSIKRYSLILILNSILLIILSLLNIPSFINIVITILPNLVGLIYLKRKNR
ncbi:MAG: hypothetical protein ACP5QP_04585 [Brevinematia bacterium]